MSSRLFGKFVWFEHRSTDPERAGAFFAEVFGWAARTKRDDGPLYPMAVGEFTMGAFVEVEADGLARFVSYVSVDDVAAAASAAVSNGGAILEPVHENPDGGIGARILDATSAECGVIRQAGHDPADRDGPHGVFCWNELHTPDPVRALRFYEAVAGWSHRAIDMGPEAGCYHIVHRDGADRGGITHHLASGAKPYWLPYVYVANCDATLDRATRCGGTVPFGPHDIPGVGRFGVIVDSLGAHVAALTPLRPTG